MMPMKHFKSEVFFFLSLVLDSVRLFTWHIGHQAGVLVDTKLILDLEGSTV